MAAALPAAQAAASDSSKHNAALEGVRTANCCRLFISRRFSFTFCCQLVVILFYVLVHCSMCAFQIKTWDEAKDKLSKETEDLLAQLTKITNESDLFEMDKLDANLRGSLAQNKPVYLAERAAITAHTQETVRRKNDQLEFGLAIYKLAHDEPSRIAKPSQESNPDWKTNLAASHTAFRAAAKHLERARIGLAKIRADVNKIKYNDGKESVARQKFISQISISDRGQADALAVEIANGHDGGVDGLASAALENLYRRFAVPVNMRYDMNTELDVLQRDPGRNIIEVLRDICIHERCTVTKLDEAVPREPVGDEDKRLQARIKEVLLVMGPSLLLILADQYVKYMDTRGQSLRLNVKIFAFQFIAQISAPCNCALIFAF